MIFDKGGGEGATLGQTLKHHAAIIGQVIIARRVKAAVRVGGGRQVLLQLTAEG